ncbi:hypothetical protein [Methylophaga sp.]|uniref:hypothetical protein n=1 Tax=Methylophaga sp. TaxID=2024840 RepID=UPI003A9530B5
MLSQKVQINKLADLEYHGSYGITQDCLDAIVMLLQLGERIEKVRLLSGEVDQTNCRDHAFLLTLVDGRDVLVNAGFRSGYGGEGSKGLSKALQLLLRHNVFIEEHEVNSALMRRLEKRCLLISDIESILASRCVSGGRYYDYIWYDTEKNGYSFDERAISALYPLMVPLAIVDNRILDLALGLEEQPDLSLTTGYRRLEGIFRDKHPDLAGLTAAKLFSKAYLGENAIMEWPDIDKSESDGRASLFIGVYKSYRNKRAHNEPSDDMASVKNQGVVLLEKQTLLIYLTS